MVAALCWGSLFAASFTVELDKMGGELQKEGCPQPVQAHFHLKLTARLMMKFQHSFIFKQDNNPKLM